MLGRLGFRHGSEIHYGPQDFPFSSSLDEETPQKINIRGPNAGISLTPCLGYPGHNLSDSVHGASFWCFGQEMVETSQDLGPDVPGLECAHGVLGKA